MPHLRGPAAVLVVVLSAALWIAHAWALPPATDTGSLSGADVPRLVAGLTSGGDLPLPPEYKSELPGAHLVSRSYGTSPEAVQFLLLSGNAESALHDPRQCMGAWHLSAPGSVRVPGTPIVAQTFEAAETGDVPNVQIAYFYVVDGHFISNPSQIRLSILGMRFGTTQRACVLLSLYPAARRQPRRRCAAAGTPAFLCRADVAGHAPQACRSLKPSLLPSRRARPALSSQCPSLPGLSARLAFRDFIYYNRVPFAAPAPHRPERTGPGE